MSTEPSELEEILLTFAAKSKPTGDKLWYGEKNMTAALSALQSLIDTQTKLARVQGAIEERKREHSINLKRWRQLEEREEKLKDTINEEKG